MIIPGLYKSAQIAASANTAIETPQQTTPQLFHCSAAVGEQSCVLFSNAARLLRLVYCGAARRVNKRNGSFLFYCSAAVEVRRSRQAELCTVFYCGSSTAAAARGAPVAALVRISPQQEYFYTIPIIPWIQVKSLGLQM